MSLPDNEMAVTPDSNAKSLSGIFRISQSTGVDEGEAFELSRSSVRFLNPHQELQIP